MVDRKRYSGLQIGRWGRLYAKLLVMAMEDALGEIINRQPYLRKVFAAAYKQGLQHLADFPWRAAVEGPPPLRLLKYVGESEADMQRFLSQNPEICLLNDDDHYAIVAAGMLRGSCVAAAEPLPRKRPEPGAMRELREYSPHFRHHSTQLLHWRNCGKLPSAEIVSSVNEDGEVCDVKTIKWLGLFRD